MHLTPWSWSWLGLALPWSWSWLGLDPSKSWSCLGLDTLWSWSWLGLGLGGLDYNTGARCLIWIVSVNKSTSTNGLYLRNLSSVSACWLPKINFSLFRKCSATPSIHPTTYNKLFEFKITEVNLCQENVFINYRHALKPANPVSICFQSPWFCIILHQCVTLRL